MSGAMRYEKTLHSGQSILRRVLLCACLGAFAVPGLSALPAQAASREATYRNFSTAPSYVKVQFEDPETRQRRWVVFGNAEFFRLIHAVWGILPGNDVPLSIETYVAFMTRHEDQPIEISLETFASFLPGVWGSDETSIRHHFEVESFERPYSLGELGFATKEEFLDAYFVFYQGGAYATLRNEGDMKGIVRGRDWEPRFIALLIDMGFSVRRGDAVPIMFIQENLPRQ